MQYVKTILTHPGTATANVREIFRELGATLETVNSCSEAQYLPGDAIILLGGGDINPRLYGQHNTHSQTPNKHRDQVEWTLARRAYAQDIPVMGICRGHQMLAVAAGGSLTQDIHTGHLTHRHPSTHDLINTHWILSRLLPTLTVNSYHHQAVCKVPYGFKTLAYSHDGLVESIWRPGVLGVQWHPEMLAFQNKGDWLPLFQWLLDGLK